MKTFKDYLIDPEGVIEEARGLPPTMDYQFDEIDPDVDKNSFRDANKDRRQREDEDHGGYAYNTADGRDPRYHLTNSELAAERRWEEEEEDDNAAVLARIRKRNEENAARHRRKPAGPRDPSGDAAEERMEYQMMHGTEEEETQLKKQKQPGIDDRVVGIMNRDIEFNNAPGSRRRGQRARRRLRSDGYKNGNVNAAQRPSQEEEEQKMPARRDRRSKIELSPKELDNRYGAAAPSTNRQVQRSNRNMRRLGGLNHKNKDAMTSSEYIRDKFGEEEEESRRSVHGGMNYDFDKRKPQRGANRHKSLPTGKSARSNRIVNNSLYRPKTKDEFVKDKANSAFKEGAVGDILAAAFGMIRENYPDDIRSYDHDPRSPFYDSRAEDAESQWLYDLFNGNNPSDMQLYLEENSYDIIDKLWGALIDTGSGSDIKVDKDKDAKFSEWLDELMLQYYDPEL